MVQMTRTKCNLFIIFLQLTVIFSLTLVTIILCENVQIAPGKAIVWGPGLTPDKITLPVRYFFIHAVDDKGNKLKSSPSEQYTVQINGCLNSVNIIDRGDGSTIVRYKIVDWCENLEIDIKYNGTHVAKSPYYIRNKIYSEKCYCPQDIPKWMLKNDCPGTNAKISWDLQPFKKVNFTAIRDNLLKRYNSPGSVSLCNYVVKNQEIYRKCYGKYTGFSMFMDATLQSLGRLIKLPDMEFFMNLGDWPLSKKGGQQRTSGPYPIFSWCGSDDSYDIVLPTYDIMESTLESMGRVTLDMLSVQQGQYMWEEKEEKVFWRGRDSRRERLQLIDLSRQHPDLINASITNFFFFRDEEEKYGPKVAHISFLDFFKYKYLINVDGTVAAYRLPYLLGGNSLVFKQDSPFYEHFYSELIPNKHFIPIKRDLSDLLEKVQYAKDNDDRAKEIAHEARKFVEEKLLPLNIYCYHVTLFKEWSKRIVSPIIVAPDMEKVEQDFKCSCTGIVRDEL